MMGIYTRYIEWRIDRLGHRMIKGRLYRRDVGWYPAVEQKHIDKYGELVRKLPEARS